VFGIVAVLATLAAVFCIVHVLLAASAAQRGKAALNGAEAALTARDTAGARRNLVVASGAFADTRSQIRALGPIASVARRIPVLGNQVKAVDTFATAGLSLSEAGQPLVDAAETVLHPADDRVPISAAMDALRKTQVLLGPAVAAVAKASDDVADLKGTFLIGPLGRARDDLVARLPRIRARATSAGDGLAALTTFAGDSGPRRYLFMSQNPDEVRPTGGFIGTYGVLTADKGQLKLDRYDDILNWTAAHPQAVVDPRQVGPPFQYHEPPLVRTLANVNSGPDFPTAAQLAVNLWKAGGEAPVNGVISFTPGFMGRILAVVGPVSVPSYDETVTAENIDERLDFYTHRVKGADPAKRKDFVAVVAETVMRKLLDAPASQWEPLGQAMGKAFEAKQAMAWSTDAKVAQTLADRHWDGAFPSQDGDFLFNAEFEYAAKNGRSIHRAYDHHVTVNPDGTARITTTVTITNTAPADPLNNSTLAYLTMYGPEGATVDVNASDPFGFKEPDAADHPAMGWFRAAQPGGGTATLKVVWNSLGAVRQDKEGLWRYDLRWLHLPDHVGDTVDLSFDLPPGWSWKGPPPPSRFNLDHEFSGSWRLSGG
jgi:hypothetical protein